jgi:hypothetical protein
MKESRVCVCEREREELTFDDEALISSLKRLMSHDTKTPPGILKIVCLFDSQDPIPDTDTERHLMRMESEDKGGSVGEETREELTTREMGSIFPETEEPERERE